MQTPAIRRLSALGTIALAGVLVASCGGAATPSAEPTPSVAATPSPAPTPSPTPKPTATPAPTESPRVDPTENLTIGAPYELAELDPVTAAMLEGGMKEALGSMSSIVQIGAREVRKDGVQLGFLLGMQITGVPAMDETTFVDSVVGGAAASSGAKVTKSTIDGHQVRVAESATTTFAAYKQDDMIVFAFGQSAKEMKAVVAALIKANN